MVQPNGRPKAPHPSEVSLLSASLGTQTGRKPCSPQSQLTCPSVSAPPPLWVWLSAVFNTRPCGRGRKSSGARSWLPRAPGELALTFDDGPNPAWTPQLIDILARYDVKATFFLLGRYAEQQRALVQRLANAGHLVGNHSWSHPTLSLSAADRIRDELRRTSDTLEQIIARPYAFSAPCSRPACHHLAPCP